MDLVYDDKKSKPKLTETNKYNLIGWRVKTSDSVIATNLSIYSAFIKAVSSEDIDKLKTYSLLGFEVISEETEMKVVDVKKYKIRNVGIWFIEVLIMSGELKHERCWVPFDFNGLYDWKEPKW